MSDRTQDQVADELPSGNSTHGTSRGYLVQVRTIGSPFNLGPKIIDGKWRVMHFEEVPNGVPTHDGPYDWYLPASGLLKYEAAQALRWWLHATSIRFGLETRLVGYKIAHSVEATEPTVYHEVTDSWKP